ncbi:hypothetical protein J6590_085263, partial [Homalodisca vitripennis]
IGTDDGGYDSNKLPPPLPTSFFHHPFPTPLPITNTHHTLGYYKVFTHINICSTCLFHSPLP